LLILSQWFERFEIKWLKYVEAKRRNEKEIKWGSLKN
jgi:hypothetical protein